MSTTPWRVSAETCGGHPRLIEFYKSRSRRRFKLAFDVLDDDGFPSTAIDDGREKAACPR